MDNTQTYR